nr:reverse transcriptase domain-containing protein [Tanacetum cinerariifolium]
GKFTFPTDFVVVDYESDPRVPLILGRPFLRTARALIDVHGEEMIICDGDERLTLNMKHDTANYSNHPHRDLVNLINIFNLSNIDYFNDIHPLFDDDPLSGSTTSSANSLLEEFTDELALITYPLDYDDNLKCDIEDDDFPSPDNEDKVFNPGIIIHEKSVTIITRVAQEKKLAISFAYLLFEDSDPPFYELLVFKVCKALADLGASINLMPLSVWKRLGLHDLIPTRMTLELANRAICTPDGIARDVFVPVGKFTFPTDFVVVDYESDPRVPLILGRPFLRTARALIDVHGEEMIICDGDERLTLNMKHDTANYSNHPHRDLVNLINIFNLSSEDCLEDFFSNK